jgi:hypothetical protein
VIDFPSGRQCGDLLGHLVEILDRDESPDALALSRFFCGQEQSPVVVLGRIHRFVFSFLARETGYTTGTHKPRTKKTPSFTKI